ncbi:hypothetical protein, partial [Exiguobacterium sp. s16]|uniref:hypothetical protein n=1 Tax=Exiguobacterium sp. s16 TaxID=2751237 RepID=UPI001BE8490E
MKKFKNALIVSLALLLLFGISKPLISEKPFTSEELAAEDFPRLWSLPTNQVAAEDFPRLWSLPTN